MPGSGLAILFDCGVDDFFADVNNSLHSAMVEAGMEGSEMVGQTFVFLSLSAEAFAAPWPYCHVEFLVDAAPSVACVEHGEFLAAANQRGVGHAGEAAAVGEHVQRVKEVALSHAVVAQETQQQPA